MAKEMKREEVVEYLYSLADQFDTQLKKEIQGRGQSTMGVRVELRLEEEGDYTFGVNINGKYRAASKYYYLTGVRGYCDKPEFTEEDSILEFLIHAFDRSGFFERVDDLNNCSTEDLMIVALQRLLISHTDGLDENDALWHVLSDRISHKNIWQRSISSQLNWRDWQKIRDMLCGTVEEEAGG